MKQIISAITILILTMFCTPLFAADDDQDKKDTDLETNDIFSARSGYIHPFLSIGAKNSDNITNTKDDTIDDWSTIYSPGIWVTTTPKHDIFLNLNTSNTSPGGRFQEVDKQETFSRFQAYALYAATIEEYSSHSERDTTKQAAEASLQANLPGSLSFDVFGKYTDSEDPMGTGDSTEIEKYTNNLYGTILQYDFTEKFSIRAEYSQFYLDYDLEISKGKNREDSSYGAYFFYNYSPKTSLFIQYENIAVSYETNTTQDSDQNYIYAGLKWRSAEKTSFKGKVGYIDRSSDNPLAPSKTGAVMEITVKHDFTAKTGIQFLASHKLNESTISTSAYSTDTTVQLSVNKNFTEKIDSILYLGYTRTDFEGNAGIGRSDDVFSITPVFRYTFTKWLQAEAEFSHTERDSDVTAFDYKTNTFYLRLNAGL
ncbi:MAG: outer membrane beta-barrel protein [Proteobacteria bacterium]|nr:outer membrane beta-barrel protein [Pseudomonadota bacterium]